MKADVTFGSGTIIGIEGKKLSEILDIACEKFCLNEIGRAKLTYKITEK